MRQTEDFNKPIQASFRGNFLAAGWADRLPSFVFIATGKRHKIILDQDQRRISLGFYLEFLFTKDTLFLNRVILLLKGLPSDIRTPLQNLDYIFAFVRSASVGLPHLQHSAIFLFAHRLL